MQRHLCSACLPTTTHTASYSAAQGTAIHTTTWECQVASRSARTVSSMSLTLDRSPSTFLLPKPSHDSANNTNEQNKEQLAPLTTGHFAKLPSRPERATIASRRTCQLSPAITINGDIYWSLAT